MFYPAIITNIIMVWSTILKICEIKEHIVQCYLIFKFQHTHAKDNQMVFHQEITYNVCIKQLEKLFTLLSKQ